MRRGPIDPRLWRYSAAGRRYLVVCVGLSTTITATVVATGVLIGHVAAGIITDPARRSLAAWTGAITALVLVIACRIVTTWWQARLAERAGASVVTELELAVLHAATHLPTRELDARRGDITVVATSGLGGLRPYLSGYLPALFVAALAPPTVLIVIGIEDPISAAIIAATAGLVPLFMILIGRLSKGRADASLQALTRLADQMLDLFAGLPTLRALGRHHGPEQRVADLGHAHRRSTMATLRIAFLSALVLELLATLCVALVAVGIGMRLVFGHMSLQAGLVALILAPEVYLPLRALGERFHAAEDGLAAATRAFDILDRPAPRRTSGNRILETGPITVELRDATVAGRDGCTPDGLDATFHSGAVTVVTGPNGCGKSTTVQIVLGLVDLTRGDVLANGISVADLDPQRWWARVAWLPQQPALIPGTLRDNAELFGACVGSATFDEACAASGFDTVLAELPDRWDTIVGVDGAGLSLGQRQRLAVARVLGTDRQVLLLDEPTAHLDLDSEAAVLGSFIRRAHNGATVVIIGHRAPVLAAADHIVEVCSHVRA